MSTINKLRDYYEQSEIVDKRGNTVLYHGTPIQNLNQILKSGLRVHSRNSKPKNLLQKGFLNYNERSVIYLTQNIQKAYLYASNRIYGENHDLSGAIIVISMKKDKLIPDEIIEDLCDESISKVLLGNSRERIKSLNETYNLLYELYTEELDKYREEFVKYFFEIQDNKLANGNELKRTSKLRKECKKLFDIFLRHDLITKLFFNNKEYLDKLSSDLNGVKIPNIRESSIALENQTERYVRTLLKSTSRKQTIISEVVKTYRNIGFSGNNKIIAIIKIDSDGNIDFPYGNESNVPRKSLDELKKEIYRTRRR